MSKPIDRSHQHHGKERGMPVKKGASWKEERTTGRKYSGEDSDKQPEPGARQQF